MQYLLLIYIPTEDVPEPATHEQWMDFTRRLGASGAMVAGDALLGTETARTVRVREGEALVTDGPFAETKEMLGGYYLIDVPDLDEALRWAAQVPNAGYGSIEVRPVMVFDRETVESAS
jgi:hypothetical protein